MRGPATQAAGQAGIVRIGGLRAGVLTSWRMVISPTVTLPGPDDTRLPAYVLFGEGQLLRYFQQAIGVAAEADLTPASPPARIGRPQPRVPRPFCLTGVLVELTATRIVIGQGTTGPARG